MDEGSSDGWREHPPPTYWMPPKGFKGIVLTYYGPAPTLPGLGSLLSLIHGRIEGNGGSLA